MLWGNSVSPNKIFVLRKTAIGIKANSRYSTSCREHFKDLKILPLPSIYIYEVLQYIHGNINKLVMPAEMHSYLLRNTDNLKNTHSRLNMTKYNRPDVNLYNLLVKAHKGHNIQTMSITVF